jgi:hypothetical protein
MYELGSLSANRLDRHALKSIDGRPQPRTGQKYQPPRCAIFSFVSQRIDEYLKNRDRSITIITLPMQRLCPARESPHFLEPIPAQR